MNHYPLLGCEPAVFPSWLSRVARTLLTSTRPTSHSLIFATRLMDADRGLGHPNLLMRVLWLGKTGTEMSSVVVTISASWISQLC